MRLFRPAGRDCACQTDRVNPLTEKRRICAVLSKGPAESESTEFKDRRPLEAEKIPNQSNPGILAFFRVELAGQQVG